MLPDDDDHRRVLESVNELLSELKEPAEYDLAEVLKQAGFGDVRARKIGVLLPLGFGRVLMAHDDAFKLRTSTFWLAEEDGTQEVCQISPFELRSCT